MPPELRGRAGHTTQVDPRSIGRLDDRIGYARVLGRFALVGGLCMIVVAVGIIYLSRRVGLEQAIDEAQKVAELNAKAVVEPAVDDKLLELDPDAIRRVDTAVRAHTLRRWLVRVKIWSPEGVVVYSDEPRLIGSRFVLDEREAAILAGAPAKAGLSDLSEPENRFESGAAELLEIYTPIRTPSGRTMLFEAYFRYEGVARAGQQVWQRFAPLFLAALGLLWLLQLPLALALTRRLRRAQDQRELLLQHALEASDAERRRIASDLHDGVVQELAGISYSLAAAGRQQDGDSGTDRIMVEAARRIREAVQSLRSLLVDIYPRNLHEEGLESALSSLLARLDGRGVTTSLEVEVPEQEVGAEATRFLYRAAQEALRNVSAHADATQVSVRVRRRDDRLLLSVWDDGRGFDPAASVEEGHVGLRTLSGLASAAGGELEVESAPGRGTTVTLEVPIA